MARSQMAMKSKKRARPLAPAAAIWPLDVREMLHRHSRLIAIIIVLVASARIISTYNIFSHTLDEPAHIACGLEWLADGAYKWEPQHPPLARIAAALGPYLLGARPQGTPRIDGFAMTREGMAI